MREDLERFYSLIQALASSARQLSDCSGRQTWPKRGVYFFREPGEVRRDHRHVRRIVRVGTHAISTGSKSTLWQRLRAHRGSRGGGGNHRGSIFRLHVGAALLQRSAFPHEPAAWGQGSSAAKEVRDSERDHEKRVSEYLGRMEVLWLEVSDEPGPESLRAYLERNSIALLSNRLSPHDPPSEAWLGRYSREKRISESGLWNLGHVGEIYDPHFIAVLERQVERMVAPP